MNVKFLLNFIIQFIVISGSRSSFIQRLSDVYSAPAVPPVVSTSSYYNKCKICPAPVVTPTTTTVAPKPIYFTPSPCQPPTCYIEKNHQLAEIDKIHKEGGQAMVEYSDAATRPIIYVAQTISNGADLIPSIFSAGGDMLGKAIAGPIQFFNRLGFSFLSGAVSQVVSIPISLGTSVRASSVLLQPYLRWFGVASRSKDCCGSPDPSLPFSQIGLRPVGLVSGPFHLVAGSILNLGGSTFRLIGTMTKAGGEAVENAGGYLKNVGSFKVADGLESVAEALKKISESKPGETICIDDGKNLSFYTSSDVAKVQDKTYSVASTALPPPPATQSYTPKPEPIATTTVVYAASPAPVMTKAKPTTVPYIATSLPPIVTEDYMTVKPVEYNTESSYRMNDDVPSIDLDGDTETESDSDK